MAVHINVKRWWPLPPPLSVSLMCVCVCVCPAGHTCLCGALPSVTAWQHAAATDPGLLGSVHETHMHVPAVRYALRGVARYAVRYA